MMSANTQTNLAIDFKSARRGKKAERWRSQRIGWWEYHTAVICTFAIYSGGRATEGKVPFEEVGFKRSGMESRIWMGAEFVGFL